ncbi:MAG TPA: hypothetical protein VFH43_00145 [Candidatus Kapabacteria bacterium]|nr:hypothetical protein [Candidatus Kapabacteria bacterium]
MKKLILLSVAFFLVSCEASTDNNDPSLNNLTPGLGSTYVINSHQGNDSVMTLTVAAILPQHMGRDKVIQMDMADGESSLFLDHEADGDISFISGSADDWVTLPVASRNTIVHDPQRKDHSSGHNITDYKAIPKGVQPLTIEGKNFSSIVSELQSVRKFYDLDGQLQDTRTWTEEFYWIPQLGFFGRTTYLSGTDTDVYDLVEYTLLP